MLAIRPRPTGAIARSGPAVVAVFPRICAILATLTSSAFYTFFSLPPHSRTERLPVCCVAPGQELKRPPLEVGRLFWLGPIGCAQANKRRGPANPPLPFTLCPLKMYTQYKKGNEHM